MEVKIYSTANCKYCQTLQKVLTEYNIKHEVIRVLRVGEQGEGIPFSEHMETVKDLPMLQRCSFPQIYIDGKYTGNINATLNYLKNENK